GGWATVACSTVGRTPAGAESRPLAGWAGGAGPPRPPESAPGGQPPLRVHEPKSHRQRDDPRIISTRLGQSKAGAGQRRSRTRRGSESESPSASHGLGGMRRIGKSGFREIFVSGRAGSGEIISGGDPMMGPDRPEADELVERAARGDDAARHELLA